MEPITVTGTLLEFNKKNANGRVYDENSIEKFRSFGGNELILVHHSEDDAKNNQLHTVIGRSKIKVDDKKIDYEISFLNTLPTDNFFEKYGKNIKKYDFVPFIDDKNELVALYFIDKSKK